MEETLMNISVAYSSYMPVLMKLISITDGPILEMGGGLFSTPYLHWACFEKRKLVTYENSEKYRRYISEFGRKNNFHKVYFIDDWDKADIVKSWNIAFIDHMPAIRRSIDAKKLANFAQYIVLHDTQPVTEHEYKYNELYPLFKYRYDYKKHPANTTILSNFIDLKDFDL
jgi:hypothetical protein